MEPDLRTFMKMSGEKFEIRRQGESEVQIAEGLRNTEKSTHRKYVGFYPDTDIHAGDWIKGTVSGDEHHIVEVSTDIVHQRVWQMKAYYETEVQCAAKM